MGKITAINPQRRPGRYNVMVDNSFAIAISEKVLVDQNLKIGQELDEAALSQIALAEDQNKALAYALRHLEDRARSEGEIRTRLKERGYEISTADLVVTKLQSYGLLDDQAFTTAWIESRARTQPGGIYKLRSELKEKGIARETIDNAIGTITEDDETELARKALAKRAGAKELPTDRAQRQAAYTRDASFLGRRGFNWNITRTVLKEHYGRIDDSDD